MHSRSRLLFLPCPLEACPTRELRRQTPPYRPLVPPRARVNRAGARGHHGHGPHLHHLVVCGRGQRHYRMPCAQQTTTTPLTTTKEQSPAPQVSPTRSCRASQCWRALKSLRVLLHTTHNVHAALSAFYFTHTLYTLHTRCTEHKMHLAHKHSSRHTRAQALHTRSRSTQHLTPLHLPLPLPLPLPLRACKRCFSQADAM